MLVKYIMWSENEPQHDKTNKMSVRPAKTQISLGIHRVWSESLLSAWRNLGSLATHWAHSEDSDQAGWMPRLIWVFPGRTHILLVLSCHGSNSFGYFTQLKTVGRAKTQDLQDKLPGILQTFFWHILPCNNSYSDLKEFNISIIVL